jgi:hypothetical protein
MAIAIFTGPPFKDSGTPRLWSSAMPPTLAEVDIELLMDRFGKRRT